MRHQRKAVNGKDRDSTSRNESVKNGSSLVILFNKTKKTPKFHCGIMEASGIKVCAKKFEIAFK